MNIIKKRIRSDSCNSDMESIEESYNKMLKVEKLNVLITCNLCQHIFTDPIILPCYESVCTKDLTGMLINESTIKCVFCEQEHLKPEHGFPVDKKIQKLLELQLNELNFETMFPKFKDCKLILNELNFKLNQLDKLNHDPVSFIYEYFSKIRSQVDVRRDNLKTSIDTISNQMINNIDRIESECIQSINNLETLSHEIEQSRASLNELINEFNTFKINDMKLNEIINKADELLPKFDNKLQQFKVSLLNGNTYKFEHSYTKIQSIFGTFGPKVIFLNFVFVIIFCFLIILNNLHRVFLTVQLS